MENTRKKILQGQTAIVTGAASGIGKEIAVAMGAEGANVVVNYISRDDKAQELVNAIKDSGGEALKIKADVSSEEQVKDMFLEATDTYGTVHILVNNAGVQDDAFIDEMSLEQWKKVIDINLTGTFLCSREAIRIFKKRGVDNELSVAAGKIICISSVHERIPWAGHANYAASKGGIMLLMKSMAMEAAPYKVRINSIGPGAVRTPINKDVSEKSWEEVRKSIPYRRTGKPEDIAKAALWLVSDESDYITGTTLFVDGGMTLYPAMATGN